LRRTEEIEEGHIEWCKADDVNPTSMRSVKEIIENSVNVVYKRRFEAEWLQACDPTPKWKRRSDCSCNEWTGNRKNMLRVVYGLKCELLTETLTRLVSTTLARVHFLRHSRSLAFAKLLYQITQVILARLLASTSSWGTVSMATLVAILIQIRHVDHHIDSSWEESARKAQSAFIRIPLQRNL
jgi:uncharacterized membrane protein